MQRRKSSKQKRLFRQEVFLYFAFFIHYAAGAGRALCARARLFDKRGCSFYDSFVSSAACDAVLYYFTVYCCAASRAVCFCGGKSL